jgi:CHAT domain-containing protein
VLEPDVALRVRGLDDAPGSASALEAALGAHLRSLSDALFPAPLRALLGSDSDIGEIVVIPDNVLALVPFAALPFGGNGEPFGARYRLRYAPSLTALIEAERRPVTVGARGGGAAPNALVVGNPVMPEVRTATGAVERLSQLAGAEREAIAVAQKLGAPMLRGATASEAEVRERMPDAAVVHLATHGYAYADPARQRDSFIALAPGDGADGLLTVGEVIDAPQPLRADLVVLSACQTALGTRTMSEGTVGLQRAFLARGARSVLVSLWNVSDVVTERLMVSFYTHWTAGASKAEALRAAQEEVRATNPNPRYWAAFQLVGAD